VIEMHGADALNSAEKSLMHPIQMEANNAEQEVAHQMIQLANPWKIRMWSESRYANGKPLVWIPMENTHHVDLEWTEDKQTKLKTLVERSTSWGGSGAWRVQRWQLACSSLVLGNT